MPIQKRAPDQFHNLLTERLALRKPEQADASDFVTLRSDTQVNQYLNRPKTLSITEAEAYMLKIEKGLNKQWFYRAISSKNSPGLIGTICLWNFNEENKSAEVGYELLPIFQGKGLMQEALSNVIVFGFKTAKFKRIIAYTHSRNDKSIKLLQKAGFIRDLSLEKELHQNNKHSDDIVFSLKRVTFLQKLRG